MILELDPLLLTGDPDIDRQHGELFAPLSAVLEASPQRRTDRAFGAFLRRAVVR